MAVGVLAVVALESIQPEVEDQWDHARYDVGVIILCGGKVEFLRTHPHRGKLRFVIIKDVVLRRVVGFPLPVGQVVDAVDVLLLLLFHLFGNIVDACCGSEPGEHVLVALDTV